VYWGIWGEWSCPTVKWPKLKCKPQYFTIKKIIPTLSSDKTLNERTREDLFDVELCTNQYGCLVVNKIVESSCFATGKPK
jgi:hypothetical protein